MELLHRGTKKENERVDGDREKESKGVGTGTEKTRREQGNVVRVQAQVHVELLHPSEFKALIFPFLCLRYRHNAPAERVSRAGS